MLTKRQNLLETINGGNPDRFVNQNEFMEFINEAPIISYMEEPGELIDEWGITWRWPEGQLGPFPVHDDEHRVLKDIVEWKQFVKAPDFYLREDIWDAAIAHASAVDRNEKFATIMIFPGIFEMTHALMSMEYALMSLYEEPEAMHELIDYLTEFELNLGKALIDHLHPDCIYHHDDWGSQLSSFVSPATFEEFFLPAYMKIYGFYKDNGVELIVHHSDSYAANLVPYMIDMGVDIWQGVMKTNNIPELIQKYGEKINFMGGLHSGEIDFPGWTAEIVKEHVDEICRECGKLYFIPCLTQAMDCSSFPGVYEETTAEIDRMSEEMFQPVNV